MRSATVSPRNVVAVSGNALCAEMFEALLDDENDHGVIFVESIPNAYRRIKQVAPYMVILFCEIDDAAACGLLSLLKADADLANVLVLTCASVRMEREAGYIVSDLQAEPPRITRSIQMN